MTPLAWHHWAKMMIGHNNDYSGHDDLVVGSPTWKPGMVSRSWACRKYRRICWKTTTGKFFSLQSMVTPISIYVSVCAWKENNHWTLAFLVIIFLHICGGGDMARNLSPPALLHREKSSHQKMDSFKIMIFIHHCTSLLFRWRQIHPRCDKQCVQHKEKLGFGCKDLKTKHRMATILLCIN